MYRVFESLGWWFGWLLVWSWWPLFRLRLSNRDAFPKEGPFLLLSNHGSVMDPGWVGIGTTRKTHFMASAGLFRNPVLGAVLRFFGAFPKQRFVKDKDSMAEVQRIWDQGRGVCIFPEGLRSWDGQVRRPSEGIGRLIQRLDAPVVFARIKTGHLFQPRWADYPRWVPVHIEYEGPIRFGANATPAEITDRVYEGIRIADDQDPGGVQLGWRLAHGLPAYLWACPGCFALEGLRVEGGDDVVCRSCSARWTVDCRQRLLGTLELTVRGAHARIVEHFGQRPHEGQEVLLEVDEGGIMRVDGPVTTSLARGRLVLRSDALSVERDGEVVWRLALSDIKLVFMEVKNALQVRDAESLYTVDCGGHSPLKWGHFLQRWT